MEIPSDGLHDLGARLRGPLLVAGDPGYDEARTIWNGMVDRRPGAIVRCGTPADAASAVRLARAHDLRRTGNGAGHNIAGNAVADGALMVDLSGMKGVSVDPGARTARVEPGCTRADVDAETRKHGMAVPRGSTPPPGPAA